MSRLTATTVNVGGTQVPQFETQRLNATVELESGQTLALGGLLQTEEDAMVTKVPILGDLPGVGVLFRSVTHTLVETELLILVTPLLVDPLQNCQRPAVLPGQESRMPNDKELFLKGQEEVPLPVAAPAGACAAHRPAAAAHRVHAGHRADSDRSYPRHGNACPDSTDGRTLALASGGVHPRRAVRRE